MREWCLRGQAALNFCRVIKDYSLLKKPQLVKGCEFVFGELSNETRGCHKQDHWGGPSLRWS